jgi:hypothetical protein
MFDEVLFGNTKKYLALLAEKEILPNQAYLAGGTAIALQLGHRISYDLDFFTPSQFQLEEILYKLKTLKMYYPTNSVTNRLELIVNFPLTFLNFLVDIGYHHAY